MEFRGLGTALIILLGHWLKSLLFGVSPNDAETLLGAIVVVMAAGMAATLLPARRASLVCIASTMREN
jgi:ABC-type lipoprotein release transport system permease subunit